MMLVKDDGNDEGMACMIKLIAFDMDGTLLDNEARLPEETYDLIRGLHAKGVRTCASSGRRYDTLCEYFEPVLNEMDFVASNGAQVYADGVLINREVFSHAAVLRLERVSSMFDCLHLVTYDRTRSFLHDEPHTYEREIDKDLPNAERVYAVPAADVNVIKVSLFCDFEEYIMDMAYALSRELSADFIFAPSGHKWIDAMPPNISKASGIQQIMDVYGIKKEELMAFGDSMNGYEVLRMAGQSCAMGNGRYAVRQIAKKVIGTNVEHGVQKALREVLESLD